MRNNNHHSDLYPKLTSRTPSLFHIPVKGFFLITLSMMMSLGSWGQTIGFNSACTDLEESRCEGFTNYPEILSCPPDVTCSSGSPVYCWYVNNQPVSRPIGYVSKDTLHTDASMFASSGTYTFKRCFSCGNDPCNDQFAANCSNEVTVVVNPNPTASISSNNTPICSGQNATFNLTGTANAVVTYNLNNGSPTITTISAGGTATVTITGATTNQTLNLESISLASTSCSQSLSGTSNVIVNPLPQGSLTANGPFCASGTGQLTFTAMVGTGPFTVEYNDGNGVRTANDVVSGTPFNVSPNTVTATTTYTLVSVRDANICARTSDFVGGSAMITIANQIIPTITILTPQTTICQGTNVTFSSQIAGGGNNPSYQWQKSVNQGQTWDSAGTTSMYADNNLVDGTRIRCILTSSETCASPQKDTSNIVIVMVNSTPTTSNAGSDQLGAATCGMTSVTLAANVPSVGTGVWTITAGTGGSITTPTSANSTFTGVSGSTYTLRWTVSNAPCPVSTDDVNITFNQNPTTSNAGSDQSGAATCGITLITLAANVPSVGTGVWTVVSGNGGLISTPTSANSTFTGVSGSTYTLRWTVSNAACPLSTDNVVITFNQNPTTSNAGSDQSGAPTCGITLITLAANVPSVGTGAWSVISGNGGSISTPTSASSTFTGVSGATYTLRWTVSNAPCPASTDNVVITFNQNPTASNAGSDQSGSSTCGITSVILTANTPSVGTGAWSVISGNGGSISTPTSASSTFTGVSGATYTLRWTVSNAPCPTSTDNVVITFNQNPTASNAGSDQSGSSTCGITSVTLTANTPSVGTGAWSVISGNGGSISTSTSANSTFTGVSGSTYALRWTVSNAPCPISTDDVIITFNPNPTALITGIPEICQGLNTIFTVSGIGGTQGYNYLWTGGSTSNNLNVVATGTYSVTVTDSKGCLGISSKQLIVNPLPFASLSLPTEVCQDGNAQIEIFGSVGNPPYNFNYKLNNVDFNISSDLNGSISFPISTNNPGKYDYILVKVRDDNGCEKSLNEDKSIRVWKNPEAVIEKSNNFPEEIDLEFSLIGLNSKIGEHSIVNYQWNFTPNLKINGANGQEISTYNGGIVEKIRAIKSSTHLIQLKVTDGKGCSDETQILPKFGNSTACTISPNQITTCALSNKVIFQLELTASVNLNTIDRIEYRCEKCLGVQTTNVKDLKPRIEVENIGSGKSVQVIAIIYQINSDGCQGEPSTIEIIFEPSGAIEGSNDFEPTPIFNNDICKNDLFKNKFIINNVFPSSNLNLTYDNFGIKETTILSLSGKFEISLDVSNIGRNEIILNKIENTKLQGCSKLLQNLIFTYTVTECRQPDLTIIPFISQDSFCLNQAGITFTAIDTNNYRGFNPINKEYSWQILDVQKNVISIASPILERRDSSVILFLEENIFKNHSTVILRSIISSNYSGSLVFKDTFDYVLFIKTSSSAPDRSTIARYPGHVYFLEDTTANLCVQWGIANDATFINVTSLNSASSPKVSDNKYAVFGNALLTTELETLKKYIWADTWFKTGPTCDFTTAECITRNYYNAALPPKGAPRSTKDTYQADIYPNPTTGQFTLALQGDWADTFTVDLLDYTGRLIRCLGQVDKEQYRSEFSIDVQGVSPGLYLLRVIGADGLGKVHKVTVY